MIEGIIKSNFLLMVLDERLQSKIGGYIKQPVLNAISAQQVFLYFGQLILHKEPVSYSRLVHHLGYVSYCKSMPSLPAFGFGHGHCREE